VKKTTALQLVRPFREFVSFVKPKETNDWMWLVDVAAGREPAVSWTVARDGRPGDLVLIYAMGISAFIAVAQVLDRDEDRHDGKPCAWIENVRFLPRPVPLQEAKRKCGFAWLRTPQGFGRGEKAGAVEILKLGGLNRSR
jgi:hypothetical protein